MMESALNSTPSNGPPTSNKKFSESLIQHYLNGYKEMRLVSSEEVLSTLMKNTGQIRKCSSLPDTPPLSPRKIRTPDEISLCSSSLPGCKFGACAIKRIQHGTWFGPFEGKLVRTTEVSGMTTDYMWEIFHDGEVSHFLDGFNENNWMGFVRCARHKKEQNLVVFQYHGCIYYRSTKDILPGNELLVWYDSKYTQLLGIPLTWNDSRGTTSKRKNSLSLCTEDQPQHHPQQRKKREKVAPLSLLQQIDYKPQPTRKNELEFLASLIAKNAPGSMAAASLYDHASPPIKKDGIPTTGLIRCDKCFCSFHNKEQFITHKCISSTPWLHPQTPVQHHRFLEKHHTTPLHRPVHVTPPYGVEQPPSTLAAHHYHNYYQNLSYAYPSPPMETMKNFNYKNNILKMKNF